MTILRSTLALARARIASGTQGTSGLNFGKYSAQNDVCSLDYSTSVRLIKTETDKAFQFLYCLPYC